jgi:trk system potassium uptake protein TrkH
MRLSLDPKNAPIGLALGWLVTILGVCMVAHGLYAWILGESTVGAFIASALLSIVIGGASIVASSRKRMVAFSMGQSFFLTLASWVVVAGFSALPVYFSDMSPPFIDAVFESVSALTTTGLSLFSDEAYFCKSLKFWRVFLQWLGGFGIVMTAVILLPILRMCGSQLMSAESSDRSDKIAPRAATMAAYLACVYTAFTIFITLCLKILTHLPWWDSVAYSMATISTGGITMSRYGVLNLTWGVKAILSMAMLMGSITLVLFVNVFRGDWRSLMQDDQVLGMLKIWGLTIVGVTLWHRKNSFIDGVFMSLSAVSGTGFSPESAFHFGGFFWITTLIGGCSGSASGGIKIFRLQIMYRMAKNHVLRSLDPNGFFPTTYNGHRLETGETEGIMAVTFFYIAGWALATTALTLCGHDLWNAFTLASSTLTNSGLPLGNWSDHVADFSLTSKWVTMVAMLCGRFECVTLVGAFWSLFRR